MPEKRMTRQAAKAREELRNDALRVIRDWWLKEGKTADELGALILEVTGVRTSPVMDAIGADLSNYQIHQVAARCRHDSIASSIKKAVETIGSIPFNSWPNHDLRCVAIALIEASAREYDDPRQLAELCAALKDLARIVAERSKETLRDQRSIAERLTMVATGHMQRLDDANPNQSAWDAILRLPKDR